MDEWSLCARCGLVTGRARDDDSGIVLCDECAKRVDQLGEASESLAHTLMRWARDQEWRGIDRDVLLEAGGLSFALFEARLMDGEALGASPQLLHSERSGSTLNLTVASGPTTVWFETFGAWDSPATRVPFLTQTEGSAGPIDVVLHYWDKRERAAGSLAFWSGDDQVLAEFSAATVGQQWGVPWNVVRVDGLTERSPQAVDDMCAIAGSLGFFPTVSRRDASVGSASVEMAGDMTGSAKELLVDTISRALPCDPGSISIRPGVLE